MLGFIRPHDYNGRGGYAAQGFMSSRHLYPQLKYSWTLEFAGAAP